MTFDDINSAFSQLNKPVTLDRDHDTENCELSGHFNPVYDENFYLFGAMIAFRIGRKHKTEDVLRTIGDRFFIHPRGNKQGEEEDSVDANYIRDVFPKLFDGDNTILITAAFDIRSSLRFSYQGFDYTLVCFIVHIFSLPETLVGFKSKTTSEDGTELIGYHYLKESKGNSYEAVLIIILLH